MLRKVTKNSRSQLVQNMDGEINKDIVVNDIVNDENIENCILNLHQQEGETEERNEDNHDNTAAVDIQGSTSSGSINESKKVQIGVDNQTEQERNNDGEGDVDAEKEKKPKKPDAVPFLTLFRYADKLDIFLIIIASIASIGNGVSRPASFVLFGEVIGKFVQHGTNSTNNNIENDMKTFAIYYVILGAYTMVCSFFQASFFALAAVRQVHRIRIKFFQSILKQDIGWFDVNESGGLTTRLSDDLTKIQTGLGDKLGLCLSTISTFFAGFGLGFYYSWELTLITLSLSPALFVISAITGKVLAKITSSEQAAYAEAGSIAEEAISSIRTVVAFGGQKDEIKRYDEKLTIAEAAGLKKATSMGVTFGVYHIIVFCCYSLTFWYGSRMIADRKITSATLLLVFFCVVTAAGQLGQLSPNFEAVSVARGAAFFVFEVCSREPVINTFSEDGKKIVNVCGDLLLDGLHFSYPSRPEIKVLDGFNLEIKQGSTVALVGESGCGKSTIVKLIQRFYDTEEGVIYLDGQDLKDLNVKSLRSQMGIVRQEPVLFDFTIAENIKFGAYEDVTQEQIEAAAKNANAHDFIINLPKGYDTKVGEGGAQLSGGQKQRVAIARALVRDPKILLFDEATSALDTESEAIVQAALDKASHGRTTIIIAHRLSTVRNADVIVAVKDGKAAEMGTHDELMAKCGVYHQLVLLQTMVEEEELEINALDMTEQEKEDLKKIKFNRSLSQLSADSDKNRQLSRQFSRQISKSSKRTISINQDSDVETDEVDEVIKPEPAAITRVISMNASEWPYIVFGSLFSAINGIFPVAFAIILSELLWTFSTPDVAELKRKSRIWSLAFLGLGFVDFLGFFFSSYMFGKAGEVLTRRLRKLTFTSIMRQDIAFFDIPENSTGQLTARLATDASSVKGATSSRLSTLVQVIVMLTTALGVAFYYSWKLTLVIMAFAPFLMFAGSAHVKIFKDFAAEEAKKLTDASALANQAIMNIRTVASLGKETYFVEGFQDILLKPYKKSLLKSNAFGITYGLASTLMMFANAGAFAYGGKLVQDGEIRYDEMFKVVLACVFGAMIAGQVTSFAPDYIAAKISAARIFKILDTVPDIDAFSEEGNKLKVVEGNINFDRVSFNYPTRPNMKVLKDLSMTITSGQKIALVGASGCGKSTSVALLERFYDPLAGTICIDDHDVKEFNVQWLRSQIGLVSQEPILFARSIKDNIIYGLDQEMDDKEIVKAATNANIHNFISGLPKGYDTMVGEKGTLISGGQKQRIAIARALIRDPKIMLLDEATSALDSESEKVVQQALDTAMEGRTSIIIAHRLSTVQNADLIIVIQGGKIVEMGTHQELITKQGAYYLLNQAQF